MVAGQCLCGSVSYRYHAEIEGTIICYCQHCQSAQGSLFAWNSPLDYAKFEIVSGVESLKNISIAPIKPVFFVKSVLVLFILIELICQLLYVCV